MMLSRTDKASILMVEFSWSGQVQVRLCDAGTEITTDTGGIQHTYSPDSVLRYEAVERTGGFDEENGTLVTSLDLGFVMQAASGRAFPPITITVFELVTDSLTGTVSTEKIYWDNTPCTVLEVNPDGEAGTAQWVMQNRKEQASASLPLSCDDNCINRFGSGKVCEFDIPANTQTATLTSIADNQLTITGLSAVPLEWFVGGYVEALGIRMRILTHDGGTGFTTLQLPSQSWIDVLPLQVSVEPGCSFTRANCAMFEQTSNFLGLGVAMERRNPLFQLSP